MLLYNLVSLTTLFIVFGAMLFLPAGNLWWVNGWLFLVFFLVLTVASVIYLGRVNPEIFAARSRIHQGTKAWDKAIVGTLVLAFFAIFPLAALDAARFRWSAVPSSLVVAGYVLAAVGYVGSVWVYSVNKFAEPTVRIQKDRGHSVISTGPYAIVRHPLYLASFFLIVGIPLALGSGWALVPAACAVPILVIRTVLEDKVLQDELPGYSEYSQRVRCRLIPGVW